MWDGGSVSSVVLSFSFFLPLSVATRHLVGLMLSLFELCTGIAGSRFRILLKWLIFSVFHFN